MEKKLPKYATIPMGAAFLVAGAALIFSGFFLIAGKSDITIGKK